MRKIKLFDGQPSSKVSQELLGVCVNEDYATDQRDALRRVHWNSLMRDNLWSARKIDENYFFLAFRTGDKLAKPPFFVAYSRLCRHCRNWPREVVSCRDFILPSVATFWVMSLVGIYPARASNMRQEVWGGVSFHVHLDRKKHNCFGSVKMNNWRVLSSE